MKSKLVMLTSGLAGLACIGLIASTAQSQLGVAKNYVQLQSTSPGTAQSGNAFISGTMRAGKFVGQGANLTDLDADALTSGTVADARLSTNVPRLNASNLFTTTNQFNGSVGIGAAPGAFSLDVSGTARVNSTSTTTALTTIGSTNGILVFFDNNGNGSGVRSEAQGTALLGVSSTGAGVRGTSNSLTGVEGNGALTGVRGDGASFGVQGVANINGVFGQGTTGVRGNGSAFGVFSEGNFGASGTKSFVIDHPMDPENQYLVHYSHEGPEPRNVYLGKVETDAKGFAWVQMPDYYEAINRDPLIQLTVVDESDDFVQVKVARRLSEGRFQIRTSKPGVEVNWRVDAIRDDAWVRAKGAPVEKAKTGAERGRYLHPELFGQPTSKAMTSVERGARRKP